MKYIDFEPGLEIEKIRFSLKSISIYRNLLRDDIVKSMCLLFDCMEGGKIEFERFLFLYSDFFFKLTKTGESSLEDYVINMIVFDENPFSCGKKRDNQIEIQDNIRKAVSADLKKLEIIAKLDSRMIKDKIECFVDDEFREMVRGLPDWHCESVSDSEESEGYINAIKNRFHKSSSWSECVDDLEMFYRKYGYGIFAKYRAFIWEHRNGQGNLKSINNPDQIQLSDLIGYENERSVVIDNTLQFLNGFSANNVLLHGDRGTGKSSTVKAILNKYYKEGLRMVELPKSHICDFPDIIKILKDKPQKFIIFIDDLVFGDDEESYTSLKSVLEGGLEKKSNNVLIYATSNRRHLVKEYFDDRSASQYMRGSEEIHSGDSRQEKLSLADRFGINVVFTSPTKKDYLEIVDGIAKKKKLDIDSSVLHKEALKWEMWYNGRSARTAVQFVDWIEGHESVKNIK
jgi:hypothetical protein